MMEFTQGYDVSRLPWWFLYGPLINVLKELKHWALLFQTDYGNQHMDPIGSGFPT